MISKLEESQYRRLLPIFHELRYNLVIDSVIDGNTPAWVYADDVVKPKTALIWNQHDDLLLAGDAQNEAINQNLKKLILEEIIPEAQRSHIPELVLHYHPKAWANEIQVLLDVLKPTRALRRYYSFDRPKFDWRNQIPSDHRMQPIGKSLLQNTDLANYHDVVGWVTSVWRTPDDFLNKGFGYCLMSENEILSWALSVYVSGKDHELGVETIPSDRMKGYGTLVAAACLEHCARQDLNPHWHCWNDNLPSIAIAEQVGFENPIKYSVYRCQVTSAE